MTYDHSNMLPAELREFQGNARRTWYFYPVLAIGALFLVAPLLIDPARDCTEYGCPMWLRGSMFVLGGLFFSGALYALIRNVEWGSQIDTANPAVIWWHGPAPANRHRIAIERVSVVRIESSSDADRLVLLDRDGNMIYFPTECVRPPPHLWASALARHFTHIQCQSR